MKNRWRGKQTPRCEVEACGGGGGGVGAAGTRREEEGEGGRGATDRRLELWDEWGWEGGGRWGRKRILMQEMRA